jgi:2-polyprenyl-6-methoxyphenol hydroxylase-like FAD-dependent oxidoreductase
MGGHPVDLWGSAVEVVERMGVLPGLEAVSTRNDIGVMLAEGQRPAEIDLKRLVVEIADRHIEIMRGRLVSVLYERTKSDVEYLFGNSITALDEGADGVRVSFERGAAREFALVIGADGQHSNVRRLAFGEEARFSRYIGGYICGYTIPNYLGLDGRIPRYAVPNKTVAAFPIRQSNEIGVGFLFRRDEPLDVHYDDVDGQKRLLREILRHGGLGDASPARLARRGARLLFRFLQSDPHGELVTRPDHFGRRRGLWPGTRRRRRYKSCGGGGLCPGAGIGRSRR